MTTPIANFNVVLVGENFPVQTVQVRDFTYRGRQLQEQLRMGPALQAGTRGVTVTILPDRFQVAVTDPDDIAIQAAGVRELVAVFRDYIGRRSATHLGHNAQVTFASDYYETVIGALVLRDQAAGFIAVASEEIQDAAVNFATRIAPGIARKVAIGKAEDGRLVLDCNVDYDFSVTDLTIDVATSELLDSLRFVEQIHQRIENFVAANGRVTT